MTQEQATILLPLFENRRTQMDSQLWGGPALLIAAQAFLYAAAFGSATPHWARIIVLALGLVPVLATWQAMASKLYIERLYSEAVGRCLSCLGVPEIRRRHPGTVLYDQKQRSTLYELIVIKLRNYHAWFLVFVVLVIADLTLLGLTLANVK